MTLKIEKKKTRSLTLRFAVAGFLACAIVPSLCFMLIGFSLEFFRADWVVRESFGRYGNSIENSALPFDSPDLAFRLGAMTDAPKQYSNPDFWIVDGDGTIFSSRASRPFPLVPSDYRDKLKSEPFKVWEKSNRNYAVIVHPLYGNGRAWLVMGVEYWHSKTQAIVAGLIVLTGVISLLVTMMAAGIFLLYFRYQAGHVRAVLQNLKSGQLDARFEIQRIDEVSSLMLAFNEMAGEIERLVGEVRQGEADRTELLQFLAHDIRTPLTSLHLISDGLTDKKLPLKTLKKNVALLSHELSFFEKLTEDLFFLAKIKHHRQDVDFTALSVGELIRGEISRMEPLARAGKKKLILGEVVDASVLGNETLFCRMVRNVILNAMKFATEKIHIQVAESLGNISITVTDDGPGFSEEKLQNFGQRKPLRYRVDSEKDATVSLGLGSVILTQIAKSHGGEVTVSNLRTKSGKLRGACVVIQLPRLYEVKAA